MPRRALSEAQGILRWELGHYRPKFEVATHRAHAHRPIPDHLGPARPQRPPTHPCLVDQDASRRPATLDALPALRTACGEALQGPGRLLVPTVRRQSAVRDPAPKRGRQGPFQCLQTSSPTRRRAAALTSVSGAPALYASANLRAAQTGRNESGGRAVEPDAKEVSGLREPCRAHRLRINVEIIC